MHIDGSLSGDRSPSPPTTVCGIKEFRSAVSSCKGSPRKTTSGRVKTRSSSCNGSPERAAAASTSMFGDSSWTEPGQTPIHWTTTHYLMQNIQTVSGHQVCHVDTTVRPQSIWINAQLILRQSLIKQPEATRNSSRKAKVVTVKSKNS